MVLSEITFDSKRKHAFIPDEILTTDPFSSSFDCACLKDKKPLLFIILILSGRSGRISDATKYAGMTQAHLEAGNLQEARRNMQRARVARDDVGEHFVRLGWVERYESRPVSAFDASAMALALKESVCTVI